MRSRLARSALIVVCGIVLLLLATANAAGYRFGVSDQAFYAPSVLNAAAPELYPRDSVLLEAQGGLMVFDQLAGWVLRRTGWSLAPMFLAVFVVSLLGLLAAGWVVARRVASSPWTAAAFCIALTLRHRITETGANSFEGYAHPRVAAFACGLAACAAIATQRVGAAWLLAVAGLLLHPTTGLWWALWLLAATWVVAPPWRTVLGVVIGLAAIGGAWMLTLGPLAARMVTMDADWIRPFASKDYVFPTAWSGGHWAANLALPIVVMAAWRWRVRCQLARPWESGMVAGVALLTLVFVLSLPFIAARNALAVQLQTSRVFWIIDVFAVLAAVWLLAEATGSRPSGVSRRGDPGGRSPDPRGRPPSGITNRGDTNRPSWRPVVVALVLLAVSAGRGLYIMRVERPDRPFVQATLETNAWVDVGRWLSQHTPVGVHVLADPDHEWKFGHSVRITARRDVLVEGTKDAAIALYDRDIALRVQQRLEAVGDFANLDAPRARALADRFDLDVVIVDHDMALPELYRNQRFRVYRLR